MFLRFSDVFFMVGTGPDPTSSVTAIKLHDETGSNAPLGRYCLQEALDSVIGQVQCILAYHWSFELYNVIFIRHYKLHQKLMPVFPAEDLVHC